MPSQSSTLEVPHPRYYQTRRPSPIKVHINATSKRNGAYFATPPALSPPSSMKRRYSEVSSLTFNNLNAALSKLPSHQRTATHESSEAQDLADRYRALHADDDDPQGPARKKTFRTDARNLVSDAASVAGLSMTAESMIYGPAAAAPTARFRLSRLEALDEVSVEAYAMIHQQGLSEEDRITCQRPGCKNRLAGLEALKHHLHMHSICVSTCDNCGGSFETRRELAMHSCRSSTWAAVQPGVAFPTLPPLRQQVARVVPGGMFVPQPASASPTRSIFPPAVAMMMPFSPIQDSFRRALRRLSCYTREILRER